MEKNRIRTQEEPVKKRCSAPRTASSKAKTAVNAASAKTKKETSVSAEIEVSAADAESTDITSMTVAERRAALEMRKVALEERKMTLDERKITLEERKMALEEAKIGGESKENDGGIVVVGGNSQPETVVKVVFAESTENWAS